MLYSMNHFVDSGDGTAILHITGSKPDTTVDVIVDSCLVEKLRETSTKKRWNWNTNTQKITRFVSDPATGNTTRENMHTCVAQIVYPAAKIAKCFVQNGNWLDMRFKNICVIFHSSSTFDDRKPDAEIIETLRNTGAWP